MDKICINNLEFIAYHGVYPEEKKLGQKFLVTVEMMTNTRNAGISGDLKNTINYGEVAVDIEKSFTKKSIDLIETCAEDIANILLKKYTLIDEVKIIVKKPWAPLQMHFENVTVEINRKRYKVYLSLGSNMGDKCQNIKKAIEKLNKIENTKVTKKSKIIETLPFGDVEQDNFMNCCVEIDTLLYPHEFLKEISKIEKDLGRDRKNAIHWGPRTIDIDILLYGNEIVQDDDLAIPHPWMQERAFVLDPLNEIAPNIIHPLLNRTIATLKRELDQKGKEEKNNKE